jgi:hypothetical protein
VRDAQLPPHENAQRGKPGGDLGERDRASPAAGRRLDDGIDDGEQRAADEQLPRKSRRRPPGSAVSGTVQITVATLAVIAMLPLSTSAVTVAITMVVQDLPDGGGGDLDAESREFAVDASVSPGRVLAGQAQDESADRADGARARAPPRRAGRGMAPLDQIAVPAQQRVRACQQQELAQLAHREVVEQSREHHAIGLGERGLADLALQDDELVPQRQDLDVLLLIAHGQEAHERERIRQGEVGQAQQHDRS